MNELRITLSGKLVNAQEMLNEVFSDECRPSMRWLRSQTAAKTIPCVRIGHLVFFDVEMVRAYLAERRLVHARGWRVREPQSLPMASGRQAIGKQVLGMVLPPRARCEFHGPLARWDTCCPVRWGGSSPNSQTIMGRKSRQTAAGRDVMVTPAATALERARLLGGWWWLDPAHAGEKCEAALAWECLRRARSYPALWRKFQKDSVPLLKQAGKPTLAGAFQQGHFIQHARVALGQPYFDFLVQGFDPARNWLELAEGQRLLAGGFVIGGNEALKLNPEFLLSRQQASRPKLSLGVVELGRGGSGEVVLAKEVTLGFGVRRVAGTDYFRCLPLSPLGRYVFVFFDTRGGRDALLESFDRELERWLGDWGTVMKKAGRLAILWNPNDRTPVEHWAPDSSSAGIQAKLNEVAVIPSEEPGHAILLVCARHNPATVRAALHTRLKTGQFKEWHSRCVEYWKSLVIERSELVCNPDGSVALNGSGRPVYRKVALPLFNPARHLPPATKPAKSGRRFDLWLGLAANDAVTAGDGLGKRSVKGGLLLENCASVSALWNHQRSAAKRLAELDGAAGRLDKNLTYWNGKSTELAAMGFFEAAAGGEGAGPTS
jgi:hypothetical protein